MVTFGFVKVLWILGMFFCVLFRLIREGSFCLLVVFF